jgi:TolA-binding protein
LFLKACALRQVQRVEEAHDLLEEVVVQFPDETAAETARVVLSEF